MKSDRRLLLNIQTNRSQKLFRLKKHPFTPKRQHNKALYMPVCPKKTVNPHPQDLMFF